jgi:hypothetical protein
VARSDGRLLRTSLRFDEPYRTCFVWPSSHRGEVYCSSSAVPCPPPYSEEIQKPSASLKRLSMMA